MEVRFAQDVGLVAVEDGRLPVAVGKGTPDTL